MFFFWGYRFFRVAKPRCPLPAPPLCMVFFCSFVCLFVSFLLWFCFCQPFPILGPSLSSPLLFSLVFLLLFCCFFSVFLLSTQASCCCCCCCCMYFCCLCCLLFYRLCFPFYTLSCLVLFPFHGFASLLFCNPSFGFAGCMPLSLTSFPPSFLLGSDLNVVL
jgi:hypothetical protein